jgi:iron complex transport system permease protein
MTGIFPAAGAVLLGGGLLVLLLLLIILSLCTGSMDLGLSDLWAVLSARAEATTRHVLLHIRLLRTLAAVAIGAALGLSGCAMQNLLRNPLASPFTLGVSQGAVFGAAFAIIVLAPGRPPEGQEAIAHAAACSPWLIAGCAFISAICTMMAIVGFAALRGLGPHAVVLAGVGLSSLFAAGTKLLQYWATDTEVAATVFWTFGDVGKVGWNDFFLIAVCLAILWAWLQLRASAMNALLWGDEVAQSLGVHVLRERLVGLMLATLATATSIAFGGIIGFIGLLAPHTMRFVTDNNYRQLVPCSALFGGCLLVFADLLGRTVMQPIELPVGILTAFAGSPLFLFLLFSRKRTPM